MNFSLEQFATRIRFQQLFLCSLAIMVIQSLLADSFWMRQLISFFYLNALWVALSASHARPVSRYLFFGLWLVSVVLHTVTLPGHEQMGWLLAKALGAVLLLICTGSVVSFVLHSKSVSSDTLFAAAIGYLFVADVFGQVYIVLHVLVPGSFSFAHPVEDASVWALQHAFNYFSFITLATLGYGDIAPIHPLVRVLASIEAVVGQFYVAVLVAWLVSRYVRDNEAASDLSDRRDAE